MCFVVVVGMVNPRHRGSGSGVSGGRVGVGEARVKLGGAEQARLYRVVLPPVHASLGAALRVNRLAFYRVYSRVLVQHVKFIQSLGWKYPQARKF
jgi:hypothetical protein